MNKLERIFMHYQNIREEELKMKVAQDYFQDFDCTKIIGNIDFCVTHFSKLPKVSNLRKDDDHLQLTETESLLWAEAKRGKSDVIKSIVQLILTIGKARTFDKNLPPAFLGAFDSEKIAFIPYNEIHDVFYINDFNWNVAPSNYETKEFKSVENNVRNIIETNSLMFDFGNDDKEIREFININFVIGKSDTSKIKIDKNNFLVIYIKWLSSVKSSIAVNWEIAKKNGIIDGDFYLADLLSLDNESLKDKLFVLLKKDHYELDRKIDEMGMFSFRNSSFNDNQKAHTQFWNKYNRPPEEEYWDYIVKRRDLLVPQDVRERKGSFFTPQKWVELSQKYLTDVLGTNWQDEYYVWDCAAGTGNLLTGLTNKYNIWASTLDTQDVEVMKDRIKNGANLLEDHVFQFDFLNDDFEKLPKPLYEIINNPEKRKKLVIYINPPYAEATTARTVTGTGENKSGVSTNNSINEYYNSKIGNASNEIFALFMAKIYDNFPDSILAQFSKLKFIQGSNFEKFKEFFQAKYRGGFIVPADTFDNVKGNFPIGFTIWDFKVKKKISNIKCDIMDRNERKIGKKVFYGQLPKSINKWFVKFQSKENFKIGLLSNYPPDFQNQNKVFIQNKPIVRSGSINIASFNLKEISIYFTVRHCIEATWLNDRDQFLYPNDGWKNDTEFQNDCLAFTLFHSQNRITSKEGINNWIPFSEYEVSSREKFDSNFIYDYIKGKLKNQSEENYNLFNFQYPSTLSLNSPSLRGTKGEFDFSLSESGGVKEFSHITPEYLESQNIYTKNLVFSDKFLPYNPNLKERSKNLRKSGILSEVILWNNLKSGQLLGYSFQRQKPILNFITDFYCKELNLVIEIDGVTHDNEESLKYDDERDRQLNVLGLMTLRIADKDVKQNLQGVISWIEEEIKTITPPNPLKDGELSHSEEKTMTFKEGELGQTEEKTTPFKEGESGQLHFSPEAKAVFDAGRVLWRYYHSQPKCNVNASLYDIREHFQGRNATGKMNNKSDDAQYMKLIDDLRDKLKLLAKKIESKVYEYEFLKG